MRQALEPRLGIIGGDGWLGNAIAAAAVETGTVDPSRLTLSSRSGKRGASQMPGVLRTVSNDELVASSDVVVISVRPDQFADIRIQAPGKLIVSVMAGITAKTLAERTGATEIVRSIPNAAAAIRRSFTPWHAVPAVTPANRALVQRLFEACGDAAEVPEETHVDYCTGMSGSGAAYPALLAEALIAHAVASGLPRAFAERAAKGVVAGASQLFAEAGEDTAAIVRTMIDYRGTTSAALQAMLDRGFNESVAAGLEAASAKAAAMSHSS